MMIGKDRTQEFNPPRVFPIMKMKQRVEISVETGESLHEGTAGCIESCHETSNEI